MPFVVHAFLWIFDPLFWYLECIRCNTKTQISNYLVKHNLYSKTRLFWHGKRVRFFWKKIPNIKGMLLRFPLPTFYCHGYRSTPVLFALSLAPIAWIANVYMGRLVLSRLQHWYLQGGWVVDTNDFSNATRARWISTLTWICRKCATKWYSKTDEKNRQNETRS